MRWAIGLAISIALAVPASWAAPADALRFRVELPEAPGPLILSNDAARLVSEWVPPTMRPAAPDAAGWSHQGRAEAPSTLGGRPGRVTTDTYAAPGLELTREVWIADTQDAVAVRQKLRNRGAEPVQLDMLTPLRCAGPDSLLLAGKGAGAWEMLIQERLKNGHPRALRPEAGMELEIDSFCLLHREGKPGQPVLLAGFLSQLGHLAQITATFGEARGGPQLERFAAECLFDGCVLPPGAERTSQWVQIQLAPEAPALMADFADRVGQYAGVNPPPRTAPSVLCTWYYYGPYFTEKYLIEDLDAIAQDWIPFDVFLIDDCWTPHWGDWFPNEKFPSGMKAAADRIRTAGYVPGIWTCPYLAEEDSQLATEHPEWLLREQDGDLVVFKMGGYTNYVLDPTYPGVCDYLEETYRRITYDWGYTYHKFDFMRSVFLNPDVKFYDPRVTRLEAYRMGLEAIRRGTGPNVYLSVCGGHYGGSLGIADSQRSGSDIRFDWEQSIPRIRQNLLRTWMSRLWHVDPDAMTVRRNDAPLNDSRHGELSLGKFSDEEAKIVALNQYVGGGLICFTERFGEIDADRKALYRHVIPSVDSSSIPLDVFSIPCPAQLLTRVTPRCADLGPWVTLAVVNWHDEERSPSVAFSETVLETIPAPRYLVSEFFSQKILGLYAAGDVVELGRQAPHTGRLLRIAPWDGRRPVLAGTDLNFSGGGVEVATWRTTETEAAGTLDTGWHYPVRITAAFPSGTGYVANSTVVAPGQKAFCIPTP